MCLLPTPWENQRKMSTCLVKLSCADEIRGLKSEFQASTEVDR